MDIVKEMGRGFIMGFTLPFRLVLYLMGNSKMLDYEKWLWNFKEVKLKTMETNNGLGCLLGCIGICLVIFTIWYVSTH